MNIEEEIKKAEDEYSEKQKELEALLKQVDVLKARLFELNAIFHYLQELEKKEKSS